MTGHEIGINLSGLAVFKDESQVRGACIAWPALPSHEITRPVCQLLSIGKGGQWPLWEYGV